MSVHLCDSNVWLALALSKHVHHDAARDWLQPFEERSTIVFCRATQQTLLRLLTNASVLAPYGDPPLTNNEAWAVFEALVADDRIVLRENEPAGLGQRWKQLSGRHAAAPKLWMDAYLAAFTMAGGYRLVTTDSGFAQFEGLDALILS